MKKVLQVLLAGVIMLSASCKKSSDSGSPVPKPGKKHEVKFSMADFTETVGGMKGLKKSPKTLDVPLKNNISYLYCKIYDKATGEEVYSKTQSKSDIAFGIIVDFFSPGNYTAVFIGSQTNAQTNISISGDKLSTGTFSFNPTSSIFDVFYKKTDFTVADVPVIKTIAMQRIVAGLNVNIEDEIPVAVKRITVSTPADQFTYKFSNDVRSGSITRTANFPLAAADVGFTNKLLQTYAFRVNSITTVSIKAYDSSNNVLFEKTVPLVMFYPNKVTTLSGKLFSTVVGFNITVNNAWDTPPPVEPF